MNPTYLPDGFDDCLTHLMEECGEVIVAAAKIKRFGLNNSDPNNPNETNLAALHRELGDLYAAIVRFDDTQP